MDKPIVARPDGVDDTKRLDTPSAVGLATVGARKALGAAGRLAESALIVVDAETGG